MQLLYLLLVPLAFLAPARTGRHERTRAVRAHRRPAGPKPRSTARVRPYASPVPHTEPPPAYNVAPRAAMVRPYLIAVEQKRAETRVQCEARLRSANMLNVRAQERADRDRLGLAVLMDIAQATGVAS